MTYTDKKCYNNQHGCQVNGYNCFKIFLLVEVCTVADDIEDNSGDNDVENHSKELTPKDYLNKDILDALPVSGDSNDISNHVLVQKPLSLILIVAKS